MSDRYLVDTNILIITVRTWQHTGRRWRTDGRLVAAQPTIGHFSGSVTTLPSLRSRLRTSSM
jgi:hypothetical protein